MSPDSRHALLGSLDGSLCLWDLTTSGCVELPLGFHMGAITAVSYSPSGTLIASGSEDSVVCIWDAVSHQPLLRTEVDSYSGILTLDFSTSGDSLLVGASVKDGNTTHCVISSIMLPQETATWSGETTMVWKSPSRQGVPYHTMNLSPAANQIAICRGESIEVHEFQAKLNDDLEKDRERFIQSPGGSVICQLTL